MIEGFDISHLNPEALLSFKDELHKELADLLPEFALITQEEISRRDTEGGFMPYDFKRKTGQHLADQVKVRDVDKGSLMFRVGTSVEYAIYVERGTIKMRSFAPFRQGGDKADKIIEKDINAIIANTLTNVIARFIGD